MQTNIRSHEYGMCLSVTQWSALSNKARQPAGPKRPAPQRQRRGTGMFRMVLLSMMLGVGWHCVVLALMGHLAWFAVCLGLPVALLTGALAGLFTVWSRRRVRGRESTLAVVATYYLALLVYAMGMTLTESILHACYGRCGPTYDLTWSKIGDEVALFAAYGTMFAVVLLPLYYVTRLLVWRADCKIRPNTTQQPSGAPSGADG